MEEKKVSITSDDIIKGIVMQLGKLALAIQIEQKCNAVTAKKKVVEFLNQMALVITEDVK